MSSFGDLFGLPRIRESALPSSIICSVSSVEDRRHGRRGRPSLNIPSGWPAEELSIKV